jgi:hypothetical protein
MTVKNFKCSNEDCPVAVTGKCVLSHDPVESCENAVVEQVVSKGSITQITAAGAQATVYHGQEMGWQQASGLFAARYGHLIGVLGESGTGKTCLLAAMYLLASCGDLRPKYEFAGSLTLPGFENRLRNLRQWSGSSLPHQIVDHTRLSDSRQAGLLHLAFRQPGRDLDPNDLIFTDLPGEMTTDAANLADKARELGFLRRADGLIVAISAPDLFADGSKNSKVQFARMLLHRLRNIIKVDMDLPITFAFTRCHETGRQIPKAAYQIMAAAQEIGFTDVSFLMIASFSDKEGVPSGMGVSDLLDRLLQRRTQSQPMPIRRISTDDRMISRYQNLNA